MCLVDNREPLATHVPTRIPRDHLHAHCASYHIPVLYVFSPCLSPKSGSTDHQLQSATRIHSYYNEATDTVRPGGSRSIYHKKQRLQLTQGISNNHLFSIMYINALCIGDKRRVHLWNMNATNFLSMYLCDYKMRIW